MVIVAMDSEEQNEVEGEKVGNLHS